MIYGLWVLNNTLLGFILLKHISVGFCPEDMIVTTVVNFLTKI